jgi:hypothetical protein
VLRISNQKDVESIVRNFLSLKFGVGRKHNFVKYTRVDLQMLQLKMFFFALGKLLVLQKQKFLIKKAKIRPNFEPLDSNFSRLQAQIIAFWLNFKPGLKIGPKNKLNLVKKICLGAQCISNKCLVLLASDSNYRQSG